MKQNHKTFLTRKRWIGLIVLILATIFTAIYACKTNIDPRRLLLQDPLDLLLLCC